MKKIFQRTGLALIVASAVTVAHAADNADFQINAEIPVDIDVASTQNMDFGQLTPGAGGGTAVIDTAGALSVTGDVTSTGGTAAPAIVTLDSTGGVTVTLDTPDVTLTNGSGGTMSVSSFTYQGGAGASNNEFVVAAGVTSTLNVGATVALAGGQASGTYTGTATVTATVQ